MLLKPITEKTASAESGVPDICGDLLCRDSLPIAGMASLFSIVEDNVDAGHALPPTRAVVTDTIFAL